MDLNFAEVSPRYGADPKTGGEVGWDEGYVSSVKQWCNSAYEEAEFDRKGSKDLREIGKFIEYIESEQWKGQGSMASYKSKPVNNKVVENFWELHGLLTDIKPFMDVKSSNVEKEYLEAAGVLNKGLKAWAFKTRYDAKLALNVCYAILTTSFCKWQWNPDLNSSMGELEAVPIGPKDLLTLKMKSDLQSSLAVIKDERVPIGWLKRRFPKRAHLVRPDISSSSYTVEPEAPANQFAVIWDMVSPAMKRAIGAQAQSRTSAFPMARFREYWLQDFSTNTAGVPVQMGKFNWKYTVAPGKPLYPRGRIVCMAGDSRAMEVMDDGANPYWHGKYPYTMLRLNAVPWSNYGLSDMRSWIHLQDILNQILAGIINMIKRNVNPGFVAPRNAFTEQTWANLDFSKPGERAGYSQSAGEKPHWVPAPSMPGYVMTTYQMIERTMEQLSGKSAAAAMMSKKQMPGSDSIESINWMRTTQVRRKAGNIEAFIEEGGNLMVPNMIQFYDQKRRMHLMGAPGSTTADFDWDPGTMIPAGVDREQFVKSMHYYVKPGSLLNTEKRQKIQDALMLRRQGDMDRRTMYTIIDEGLDVDKIEDNLKKEAKEGMALKPTKGKK